MKWIVVIATALVLVGAMLSLRTARGPRAGDGLERQHRLYDSTSRRRPPTAGDEP
ncbi:hypothetical protein [Aeromicrobium wangtongii]|uniref:hypothetical protein n=1 Tax=Aeromicrobium wangtongii TaxID=2969247 RepID=UPI002017DDA5|nr:hypothetical protein [Aeromicrobium wangtongii]MCL3817472.1 hypothetical protein [Aeromicrobium wangtongii]